MKVLVINFSERFYFQLFCFNQILNEQCYINAMSIIFITLLISIF
jgi:hypothetical protein